MSTKIKIPASWGVMRIDDGKVNAWFASKGATVIGRTRGGALKDVITVSQNLTPAQQTALTSMLSAALNSIEYEVSS